MKTTIFTLSLVALFQGISFAQNLTFSRTYGGPSYEDARGIVSAGDGCFVFTGLDKGHEDPTGDMYLTKVNAAGAVMWIRYYGLPKEDGGNYLLKTSDGGFLISGHTANSYGEECDGYIVKTDANGQKQWHRFVGTTLDDVCTGAVEASDGNFYITGRVQDPGTRLFDAFFCKISPDGQVLKMSSLSWPGSQYGQRIAEAQDGNLLIAGYSQVDAAADEDMLVLKCSKDGDIIWVRIFGTPQHDRALALLPHPDGGCIVGGGTSARPYSDDYREMRLAKLDAGGSLESFFPYVPSPGQGFLKDGCITAQGDLAFCGVFQNEGQPWGSPCLLITDFSLQNFDFQVIATPAAAQARSICQNENGEYAVAGFMEPQQGNMDQFVAKTIFGNKLLNARETALQPYLLFPNPFTDITYLKLTSPYPHKKIKLFTSKGALVQTLPFEGDELMIQGDDLVPGTYFFNIENGKGQLISQGQLIKW